MQDLEADKMIMWQQKHYLKLCFLLSILAPFAFGYYVVGDSVTASFWGHLVLRHNLILHFVCLINSVAHKWGYKEYDKYEHFLAITQSVIERLV